MLSGLGPTDLGLVLHLMLELGACLSSMKLSGFFEDKLDYCQSRCLYDESCSGYMIKGSGSTPELMSPGQPCIFFRHLDQG